MVHVFSIASFALLWIFLGALVWLMIKLIRRFTAEQGPFDHGL